jgi:sec-independent protein translocase protein TatA
MYEMAVLPLGGGSMGELLTPTHLMVIAVVTFVLFGAKRLPELGRGLGDGLRGFKDGMKGFAEEPEFSRSDALAPKSKSKN